MARKNKEQQRSPTHENEVKERSPATRRTRGLPWGIWTGGTECDESQIVQNYLCSQRKRTCPESWNNRSRHVPKNEEPEGIAAGVIRKLSQKLKVPPGRSEMDANIEKCASDTVAIEERLLVRKPPMNAFEKANMSQFSSANALRTNIKSEKERENRLQRCRKKYEDFR